jgi:hypothetical protein
VEKGWFRSALVTVAEWLVKAWDFVKRFWKPIAIALGALAAIVVGVQVVGIVRKSIFGKVDPEKSGTFRKLDDTHLAVKNAAGQWEAVELGKDSKGKQVTVADVRAVQLRPSMPAIVETRNAKFDEI